MKKEKTEKNFISRPSYPGGTEALKVFIRKNLIYPDKAKINKISGTVKVNYTINHLGNVVEAKVIAGLGFGCDEEAIRLVKLLKFNVPKNRKVRVLYHKNILIHFQLKEDSATGQYQYEIVPTEKSKNNKSGNSYHYQINI